MLVLGKIIEGSTQKFLTRQKGRLGETMAKWNASVVGDLDICNVNVLLRKDRLGHPTPGMGVKRGIVGEDARVRDIMNMSARRL